MTFVMLDEAKILILGMFLNSAKDDEEKNSDAVKMILINANMILIASINSPLV